MCVTRTKQNLHHFWGESKPVSDFYLIFKNWRQKLGTQRHLVTFWGNFDNSWLPAFQNHNKQHVRQNCQKKKHDKIISTFSTLACHSHFNKKKLKCVYLIYTSQSRGTSRYTDTQEYPKKSCEVHFMCLKEFIIILIVKNLA